MIGAACVDDVPHMTPAFGPSFSCCFKYFAFPPQRPFGPQSCYTDHYPIRTLVCVVVVAVVLLSVVALWTMPAVVLPVLNGKTKSPRLSP